MQYEAHITVQEQDIERWQKVCAALGVRPLAIRLPEGEHLLQVMCTAKYDGTADEARAWISALAARVRGKGYTVLRTKLESAIVDAQTEPAIYYECHFKLLPQESLSLALLQQLKARGIYTSENLLPSSDGTCYWYMTARTYGGTPAGARAAFAEALRVVRDRLAVKAAHFEHVIFDSWPGIDQGWIALPQT